MGPRISIAILVAAASLVGAALLDRFGSEGGHFRDVLIVIIKLTAIIVLFRWFIMNVLTLIFS